MRRVMLLLAISVLSLATPAWGGKNSALVGSWSGEFGGEPFQLILNADGTGQMDGPIQWEVEGDQLVITEDDGATEYKFVLKGSTLTVSGGDLEEPLTFTRIGGAGQASPPVAQAPATKSRGSAAQFLAGQYWAFSGHSTNSGSYSREQRAALCSDGTFFMNRETASSGSSGTAGIHGGDSGRWTVQGNERRGTLTLSFTNGQQEQIPYETSTNPKDRSSYGPAVIFDGTVFQRTGDGLCR